LERKKITLESKFQNKLNKFIIITISRKDFPEFLDISRSVIILIIQAPLRFFKILRNCSGSRERPAKFPDLNALQGDQGFP
jgi:tetraacyldisaccharide-1-P 4'-kinase